MASDRSKKGQKAKGASKDESSSGPRASLDDTARPPVFALPQTKAERQSIAPPAPPPSQAPRPPTVHDLFDVETADADHARAEVSRPPAARASVRPHPPRRQPKPSEPPVTRASEAPDATDDPAQRLSTPLSWAAAKSPLLDGVSDQLLEPAIESASLELPPLGGSEPLARAIPTESLVVPAPPAPERRRGFAGVAVGVGVALVAVGVVVGSRSGGREATAPVRNPAVVGARTEAVPAPHEAKAAAVVPAPPPELDLGVPSSAPSASAEPETKQESAPVPAPAPESVVAPEPGLAPAAASVPAPAEVDAPPFDQRAASAALAEAAASASVCRKPDDPTGSATVIVRYAPSGRVTSATVEAGPFAGTVTGGCVAMMFRKALVPPFSGDYVTVKKTVSLK